MNIQSCKAKGRRAAQEARDALIEASGLPQADIHVTSSSVTGEDLLLSPAAVSIYPYVFEVKCQERLSFYAALAQAESHRTPDREPVLVFRRNKDKLRCIIDFDYFCELSVKANGKELS